MQVVLEGILFVLCEGCSWRAIDRPHARWNSVYQYFRRWCQRGTLQQVLTQYGPELAPGWHFLMIYKHALGIGQRLLIWYDNNAVQQRN